MQSRATVGIEQLESRQLLSVTGYTTETVANFETIGLKNPWQTVVRDSSGDIFGIARGGANDDGGIWEIPVTTKVLTLVAAFDGTDGQVPSGGLFKDANGNIYGVCSAGGANNDGTVWELPVGQTSITLLASFDSKTTGDSPSGQVYVDSSGNVFGAAQNGGANDIGDVWEYNASTQTITDLADFNDITNGANAYGGLISDGKGNFFGTTFNGGDEDDGTVWKYQLGSSSVTTLANFDGASAGANPEGGIAIDSAGDLFGTSEGPTNIDTDTNDWELPAGSNTINTLAFFPVPKVEIFFGAAPESPVILDSNGDVVGAAEFGGVEAQGSIWAIHPGGSLTTFHAFTPKGGNTPDSSLLLDSFGDIFGTTELGGTDDDGTAFVSLPPGNIPSTHLAFTVQPVNTQSNGDFTANVQVSVEGAGNRVVTTDNSAVTIALNMGSGVQLPIVFAGERGLGGTLTVNAVDGVATFTDLTLPVAGKFTLKATDGALIPAISKPFMVPTVIQLVVAQQPTSEAAGGTMSTPISIKVEDQFDNPLTTSHTPVKLTLQSSPALAKLAAPTAPPVNGVATFTKLSATKAGTYTLTASDGTATPITLNPFTVNPAAAAKMLFSIQPTATTEGAPFSVAVELSDKFGNVALNDTSDVTLALAAHPAGSVLDGTLTEPVIDGLADFSGLSLETAGTYSLLATDSNAIKAVMSVKFAVTG
jgi:uncharacterized repeat protein (TIGR03803 family)